MDHPELWEPNSTHSEFVGELLEEHKNKFNWRADGRDTLMDIGCAGGGITIERILPIMPPNFDRLIGVDVSNEMIAYAKKAHSHPNIEFKTFDIVNGDTKELPQVDHIISFYVFHHLYDHEKAVRNIYDLLKPGGDCFIAFIPNFALYTGFEQTARGPKWSEYIKNVNDVIIPSHYSKDTASDFEKLLKECNFSSVEISFREKSIEIGDVNILKDILKTPREFYKEIPVAEHDAFTDDFAQETLKAYNAVPYNNHSTESKVYVPMGTLTAYAKK